MENVDNIFWDKITNATSFIDDLAKRLNRKNSVILNSSDEIPWYNSFRSKVENKISIFDIEICHENELEHEHIFDNEEELENYILNNSNYFEGKKQNEYRSSMKLSKFIAENDNGILIHKKYIWVDVYSRKSFENWVKFVSEYIEARENYLELEEKYDKIMAGFVISYHGDSHSTFRINSYSFKDYVDWYDSYVFFSMILSDLNEKENLKRYLSDFISNIIKDKNKISGKYIEICIKCLENYNSFLKSPYEYLKSLNCDISEKKVKDSEWRSQIRIIYPILEEFRQNFVRRYIIEINKNFKKFEDSNAKNYVPIKEAMDCDLGILKHVGRVYNLFPIDELEKYWFARNELSHLRTISIKKLKEII